MRRVKVTLSIGFATAKRQTVIEVEDDATEDEIWEAAEDWAQQYMSVSWEEES